MASGRFKKLIFGTGLSKTDNGDESVTIAVTGAPPTGSAGGVLDGTYPNPGIAASVAGNGLAETTNVLSVNVDGSSLEINSDALRVKAGGVTEAMLGLTDITTANASTAAHGLLRKLDNNSAHFLDGTGAWATPSGGGTGVATDPIWDAKGDVVAATGADASVRVPLGTDGHVLTADSAQTAGVKWAAASGSGSVATDAIWDAKGDLAGGTGADAAARLAVGANGKMLVAASGETTGMKWIYPPGYQLDYAEPSGSTTVTSTADGASGGTLIVAGNAVSYDGSTVILIEFYACYTQYNVTSQNLLVNLYEGTTDLGRMSNMSPPSSANMLCPMYGARKLTPSNASHTYSIRGWKTSASGTAVVGSGAGGSSAYMPAFIRITVV